MAKSKLVLKMPWWSGLYIKYCALFSLFFGLEPDYRKISDTIVKRSKVVAK